MHVPHGIPYQLMDSGVLLGASVGVQPDAHAYPPRLQISVSMPVNHGQLDRLLPRNGPTEGLRTQIARVERSRSHMTNNRPVLEHLCAPQDESTVSPSNAPPSYPGQSCCLVSLKIWIYLSKVVSLCNHLPAHKVKIMKQYLYV